MTNTLVRELDPALRECVRQVFVKVGKVALAIHDEAPHVDAGAANEKAAAAPPAPPTKQS